MSAAEEGWAGEARLVLPVEQLDPDLVEEEEL